jgi:hypothetical protein
LAGDPSPVVIGYVSAEGGAISSLRKTDGMLKREQTMLPLF